MKSKKTVIVGLTGQTGAGKSVVSELLSDRGFRVIDCDAVARTVVEKGKQCLIELAVEFGAEIINADGTLNRKKLGNIVFSDGRKRKRLGEITFPHIQDEILVMADRYRESGEAAVFLDAPTLIESGTDKYCDKVVSVIAPSEERFIRIIRRDGLTADEAGKRMSAQGGDEYYTSRSDFVINNTGNMTELKIKVMEMLDFIGVDLPGSQKDG